MKKTILFTLLLTLSLSVLAQTTEVTKSDFSYAPGFRYCPDRDYDLAWENDLVAFRIYGKEPHKNAGNSGVDCWHKRVSYPILDKWYSQPFEGKTYHEDYGEGCDQYHVGTSRGCGGVGIWKDNAVHPSGLYESWEVISQTQTTLKFKLTYRFKLEDEEILETRVITIENGSQLYHAESQFTKNTQPVKGLEIAVGLNTFDISDVEVSLNEEEGWLSVWHSLGNESGKIGTGAIVDTKYLVKMLDHKPEDGAPSNAIAIIKTDDNGIIKYKAGFAWEKAGKIQDKETWNEYLRVY